VTVSLQQFAEELILREAAPFLYRRRQPNAGCLRLRETGDQLFRETLYAAGEITGLYHKHPPATSVLRANTFGRIVGANVAESLSVASTG